RIIAVPCPTPTHIVASPYRASSRSMRPSRVTRRREPEEPSGWPRAIAPPSVFTRRGSNCRRRMHARAWVAKASLSSIAPMSSVARPARARAFSVAGTGPSPITSGARAAAVAVTIRARGLNRYFSTAAREARRSGGAVVEGGGVPRGDDAAAGDHRAELRQRGERRIGPGALVGGDGAGAAAAEIDGDGQDLVVEMARRDRPERPLVAFVGETVGLGPGDPIGAGDLFGRFRHRVGCLITRREGGIGEAPPDGGIELGAGPRPGARGFRLDPRCAGHRFHPAGEDDI